MKIEEGGSKAERTEPFPEVKLYALCFGLLYPCTVSGMTNDDFVKQHQKSQPSKHTRKQELSNTILIASCPPFLSDEALA